MPARWYVLRTKPHKERAVYRMLLEEDDFDVYFPALRVKPVNPRASKIRPYFPGYMFVNIDLEEEGENALRWTPGTRGLVRFGGQAAPVPEHLIYELQKRLAALQEEKDQPKDDFQTGDRVRIVDGPLAGYEAIFDTRLSGRDRVQLLLSLLSGQPTRVKLEDEQIEKVE